MNYFTKIGIALATVATIGGCSADLERQVDAQQQYITRLHTEIVSERAKHREALAKRCDYYREGDFVSIACGDLDGNDYAQTPGCTTTKTKGGVFVRCHAHEGSADRLSAQKMSNGRLHRHQDR